MKKNNLPTAQKIIAFIFAAAIMASFVFFAYRIHTKASYEAHEKKQARVLAISALLALEEETSKDPGTWNKFREDKFDLILDHMKVRGNWAIKLSFNRRETHLEILSSVKSGWNSRSPQHAEARAAISPDGRMSFDHGSPPPEALEIKSASKKGSGRRLNLRFPEELKPLPVAIDVEEYSMTDEDGNTFIILKRSEASEHLAPAID
jgi:hypothetical protein